MSKEEVIYDEKCAHCRKNPNAEKPFKKMKRVYMDDLTIELLEKSGELSGLKADCVACKAMGEFLLEWERKSQA